MESHGIKEWRIAQKYQLGCVVDPLPGDEWHTGRISLPYLSPGGVVSIRFRELAKTGQRYYGMKGENIRLYNPQALHDAGMTIGIAEGEIDAIAATERLGIPTVGVPGSSNWKDPWTHLFKDFTNVFIFQDGDDAGEAWATRVEDIIGYRARIVRCPEGQDVSSMAAAGRSDELLAKCSTSNYEDDE